MDNEIDKRTMDGHPRLDSPERSRRDGRPVLWNFPGCSTLSRLVNRGLSEDPSATTMNPRGFIASSAMAVGTSLVASLAKEKLE